MRDHQQQSVSKTEEERRHFANLIEKQKVDNITLEFFYKPHTLTLLFATVVWIIYMALNRSSTTLKEDISDGGIAVCIIFLIISILVMPNGPFIRPHPAVWRIVFGVSVLYFLVMVFVCFLSYDDARRALHFMFPDLLNMTIDDILDKDYAVNCSEVTFSRLYSHMDGFAMAHLFGWVMKAVLLRHYGLSWLLSVNWEITELAFSHILPNFKECWWDIVLLDIVLCNGVGIFLGMHVCKWLEMRSYHWESIRGSNWLLMYFGFCHCPDVCPEQMEKMTEVVDRLRLAREPHAVTPVFVSIDPERDTPALVKEYIADFGGMFVGLTGSKPEVEAVVKKYRVYYSKGPVDQDGDYIVDHAIIMYLVSPSGSVVDYYGQTKTSKDIAACIGKVIKGYKA